jgi:hypothetical protein
LTTLADGSSYLIAGNNVTITSQSNGSVIVAATATSVPSFQAASFTSNDTWISPVTGPVMLIGFGGGGGLSSSGVGSGGGGGGSAGNPTGFNGGNGGSGYLTIIWVA